jgi:hypothetical protein
LIISYVLVFIGLQKFEIKSHKSVTNLCHNCIDTQLIVRNISAD